MTTSNSGKREKRKWMEGNFEKYRIKYKGQFPRYEGHTVPERKGTTDA